MLPEQVWDDRPPAGRPGFAPGTGTLSATPLAWTHAQFIRLAWSIDAGRPVERPDVVACRYAKALLGAQRDGAGRLAALLEVALVVVLGRPERRRGGDLGDDPAAPAEQPAPAVLLERRLLGVARAQRRLLLLR